MHSALRQRSIILDGHGGHSVFISYWRQLSGDLAMLVCKDLTEHHFDTFMDVENLDSGEFERTILSQIEAREHFIVLLQPGSLDRIGEDGDWLRREIAHALAHHRNVVPVTAHGFEFRRDLVLPADIARLSSFNALPIPPGLLQEAMERLRTRFLKMPSKPVAPPRPDTSVVVGLARQAMARSGKLPSGDAPLVLSAPQLTGVSGNPLEVQLTWSEVRGASEYVLERAGDVDPMSFREVYRGPNRSYKRAGPQGSSRTWHSCSTESAPASTAKLGDGATL